MQDKPQEKSPNKRQENPQDKQYAVGLRNLLWIAVGVGLIVLGNILMTGSPSTEEAYNPDIFGARRLIVAPIVCFAGFAVVLAGILIKPKKKTKE